MAEEIVAKLKIDETALQGKLGRMAGPGGAGLGGALGEQKKQTKLLGGMTAAVTAGLAIWEGIKKGVGALVKASPALQNTLQIFGQTFSLLLKPIGDLFSLILRPFALAFLRWAIPFYKDPLKGLADIVSKIGGPLSVVPGIPRPIAELAELTLGDKIEEWKTAILDFFANIDWGELWGGVTDFFAETVPSWVDSLITSIGGFFLETLPYVAGYVFEKIVTFFSTTAPDAVRVLSEKIKILFTKTLINSTDKMKVGIINAWNGVKNFIVNIPENIIKGFDKVKIFLTKTIPGWFESLFNGIRNAIDKVKSTFSFGRSSAREEEKTSESTEGKAVGGVVFQGSSYVVGENGPELFTPTAGGRITPNNRLGTTFSPNITIHANVSNDIDIRRLASQLSEYMQTELSRSTNDFRR